MRSSGFIMTCALRIADKTVTLAVVRDDPSWRWEMCLASQKLDSGVAATRLGAQTAAQYAFERRLRRAGLNQGNFTGYRWNDSNEN